MPAVTIEIPETLSQQLGPYRDNLDDLLWMTPLKKGRSNSRFLANWVH